MGHAAAGADSVNAYVDAVSGRDAARKGQKGRLKFTNKPQKGRDDNDDDDMDTDEQEIAKARKSNQRGARMPRGRGARANGVSGRGAQSPRERGRGMTTARIQRRGLGVGKARQRVSSGRVGK